MQITFNQILTNGMIDKLKEDPEIVGFIVGALDNGWAVSMTGACIAKMNKVRIMTHAKGDKVFIFLRTQIVKEIPRDGFQWCEIVVRKGNLFYRTQFITKTAPDYGRSDTA